jgi:hypothetical protein
MTDDLLRGHTAATRGTHSLGRSGDALPITPAAAEPASPGTGGKRDKINRPRTWHDSGSGWISGAIYGANERASPPSSASSPVSRARRAVPTSVQTAGWRAPFASAHLGLATGAFLAERSRGRDRRGEHRPGSGGRSQSTPRRRRRSLRSSIPAQGQDEGNQPNAIAEEQSTGSRRDAPRADRLRNSGGAEPRGPSCPAVLRGEEISTGVRRDHPRDFRCFWLLGATAGDRGGRRVSRRAFRRGAAKSLFTLRSWWGVRSSRDDPGGR